MEGEKNPLLIEVPGGEEEGTAPGYTRPVSREEQREESIAEFVEQIARTEEYEEAVRIASESGDWEDVAKVDLEHELEVQTEYMRYDYYDRLGGFALKAVPDGAEGSNGESEWIIFKNDEDAHYAAVAKVKDDIEVNPDIMSADFLSSYIDPLSNFDELASEEGARFAEDLEVDDLVEHGYLEAEDEDGNPIEEYTDEELEEARSQAAESYEEDILHEGPVRYFQEMYGREEGAKEAIKALGIDADRAAEDVVSNDGVDNTLDIYDGNGVELPNGGWAYGVN